MRTHVCVCVLLCARARTKVRRRFWKCVCCMCVWCGGWLFAKDISLCVLLEYSYLVILFCYPVIQLKVTSPNMFIFFHIVLCEND